MTRLNVRRGGFYIARALQFPVILYVLARLGILSYAFLSRRRRFVALLIVFAVWAGVLVMMYFTTVRAHHQRRRPPAPQPRATAAVLETPAAKSLSSWMR